jgi:hypothetical protein
MGRPNPTRNMDSRTRLLNSLGHFKPQEQQQQQRDGQSIPGPSGANDAEIRSGPGGGGGNNNDNTSATSEKIKKLNRHRRYNSDIPVRSALHNTIAFKTKLNDDESTDVPHPLLRTAMKKEKPPRHTRRSSYSPESKIISNSNDDATSGEGGGGGGGVRFNTVVSGVQIPSRNQYSKRIKQQLWRDRHELHEMVERNTTEFHAENYDWTQVVLDDEMYIDSTSGERVHPCHVLGNNSFTDDEDDDDDDDDFSFTPLTRSDSAITSASPTTTTTTTPTGRSL